MEDFKICLSEWIHAFCTKTVTKEILRRDQKDQWVNIENYKIYDSVNYIVALYQQTTNSCTKASLSGNFG